MKMNTIIAEKTWASPVGNILVRISEEGVREISVTNKKVDQKGTSKILDACMKQLEEYFAGKRSSFDLPLAAEGTPFQQKVWSASQKIPAGKTVSYGQLATMIGKPSASRAVGSALGKNPVCIVVPCHRIVSSTGKGGGYAYGMKMKNYLLKLEQSC